MGFIIRAMSGCIDSRDHYVSADSSMATLVNHSESELTSSRSDFPNVMQAILENLDILLVGWLLSLLILAFIHILLISWQKKPQVAVKLKTVASSERDPREPMELKEIV